MGISHPPGNCKLVKQSTPAKNESFVTDTILAVHENRATPEWYKLRWRIEDWYRVLKSGCKVEYLGHRQGERIERAVTINAVIAWRLTLMTLLGRDTPELPADTLFTEIELAALEDFAQDRRQLPPDNLGRAVLTLAMLGGYLNYKRKQYAVPGHKVMWEGLLYFGLFCMTIFGLFQTQIW